MSDFWQSPDTQSVSTASLRHAPRDAGFVPWSSKFGDRRDEAITHEDDSAIDPEHDIGRIQAEAFSEGFNEGRRTVEMEVAAERMAIARLAETLEQYRPEPPAELALLLAETVDRLVRQIVGEAVVDTAMLETRVATVAAIITDSVAPAKMRLHPDDLERLDSANMELEMVGDPHLHPGSVIVETTSGWIEDGPEIGIERLRLALERMSVPQ